MSNVVKFGTTFLLYLELKFHLKQHFPLYIYGEQQFEGLERHLCHTLELGEDGD